MAIAGEAGRNHHGWNTKGRRGVYPGTKARTSAMKNGPGRIAPRAFGEAGNIGVQRALTEFRAGRPILIEGADAVLAMPIDGATAERIAAFQALSFPAQVRLVV